MSSRPLYSSQNFESSGISSTQGGHQVAQKWMTTRRPFSFDMSTFLPCRSKIGSSGAVERDASEPPGESGGTSDREKTVPTATIATAKTSVRTLRVVMIDSLVH